MSNDLCSTFNLSGTSLNICNALEKMPLTANFLYNIYKKIEPKLPILTYGIQNNINQNIKKINIENTILIQLPWILCFWALIAILWYFNIINNRVFIALIIFSILITAVIIIIYLYLYKRSTENLMNEIKTQLTTNFKKFKNSGFTF